MSDVKRSAAPTKAGASVQPPDALEALGSAIGARVKIATVAPVSSTLEGTLFTACSTFNVVALKTAIEPGTSPAASTADDRGDYHVIPINKIQSFEVLSLEGVSGAGAIPSIGAIDAKALQHRETARVRELQEIKSRTNVNVPAEAQILFDALYRIYPTTWRDQDIQVSNAVIIPPPYTQCKPFPGKENTLQRFQMIVDGERKKMAQRTGQ